MPHKSKDKDDSKKITFDNVLIFILLTFIAIAAVLLLVIIYFTFAGITFLTLYLLLYEWISLFTKEPLHMVLSIFVNFSDFGLFFILALICVYIIKDYFTIVKIVFKLYLGLVKSFLEPEESGNSSCCSNFTSFLIFLLLFIPTCGIIALLIFIIMKWLFYVSAAFEALILLAIIIGTLIFKIKNRKQSIENSHHSTDDSSLSLESDIGNNNEDEDNEKSQSKISTKSDRKSAKSNESSEKQFVISEKDDEYEYDQDDEGDNNDDQENIVNINDQSIVNNKENDDVDVDDVDVENCVKNDKDVDEKSESDVYSYSNESDESSSSSLIDKIEYLNDSIFTIATLDGMFCNSRATKCCRHHQTIYRIIISMIIFSLQLYSILIPFLKGSINYIEFIIYLIVKLLFGEKILAFNLFDLVFNKKRVMRSLKKKKAKIVFWLIFIMYIIVVIAFFVLFTISKLAVFPTVERSTYFEDNQKWYKKSANVSMIPEGFCNVRAQNDGSLKTEDFAMLATLPRLYDVTKSGRCYIKPSKRGLFNTTMKYIFGKDYEKDNIRIFCKKLTHNPILIISSDKILNNTLSYFSREKVTLLPSQFDIVNTDYFDGVSLSNLNNNEGEKLLNDYRNCIKLHKKNEKCETEWDKFTQFYWPSTFSDDFVDIPGFERYQINFDSDLIFQPSFVSIENGKLWSGTHYIVGGSYEDSWGVGFFIETVGRKYIPQILENFLPLYKFIRNIAKSVFLRIEWFNKHIFYFDVSSSLEMKSLEKLCAQFNFTHESLYLIGHSITGTAFKGISLLTDIQGITFEASDGENNLNFYDGKKLNKNGQSNSQITNIFSDGTVFTGNDDNCDVNGVLPKRYIFPSVYDTACLTAITCSDTMKYVPLCMQVLTQNKKDPVSEFNISFNSYLRHYGYN